MPLKSHPSPSVCRCVVRSVFCVRRLGVVKVVPPFFVCTYRRDRVMRFVDSICRLRERTIIVSSTSLGWDDHGPLEHVTCLRNDDRKRPFEGDVDMRLSKTPHTVMFLNGNALRPSIRSGACRQLKRSYNADAVTTVKYTVDTKRPLHHKEQNTRGADIWPFQRVPCCFGVWLF